jgi:sulfur-oxidizing protein SoxB
MRPLALLALMSAACRQAPSPEEGAERTIRLLHLNDLHAHLTPHLDVVPDAPVGQVAAELRYEQRGGLARLATLVRELRAEQPASVLMNIGDTYHGGAEALFTSGNAVVGPVDALGIDLGVPGNWDFAYGPASTRLRYTDLTADELPLALRPFLHDLEIEKVGFPNLAANVTDTLTGEFLPPVATLEVGGVQVGFVGLTSDMVPDMHRLMALGFEFTEGEAAYLELVGDHADELRARGAEIVVVMSELGIHKDHQLARALPAGVVDVFFSAHTHEATFTPLQPLPGGALVVEAGNDGYLGVMDVTLRADGTADFAWSLRPITADLPEDPGMAALVEQARAPFLADGLDLGLPGGESSQRLQQPLDTVVGFAASPLHRRHVLDSPFNRYLAELVREEGGAEVAVTPGFRFDAPVAEAGALLEDDTVADGAITLEDLYRFVPAPYTLSTGRVDGGRLREILEEALTRALSRDAFAQSGGWFDGLAGLELDIDMTAPDGQRISSIALEGRPLRDTQPVTVAGCSRPLDAPDVLCSYSGFTSVEPLLGPSGSPWTPIDLLARGLSAGGPIATPAPYARELSETPLFPEGPWVQPVWTDGL